MSSPLSPDSGKPTASGGHALALRHLRFGWWCLVVFLTLGLGLEALQGIKASFYLDVSNHTRRLMWTLAHAHGTLIGLVQIAFAATLNYAPGWDPRPRSFASACLIGAGFLLPLGFFLGGLIIHGGDPGIGIVLVPVGALLLAIAGILTIRGLRDGRSPSSTPSPSAAAPKRQVSRAR
jgi:hypothetical protein